MAARLPRLLAELPAPDPILAETVQLRAELHTAKRRLAARTAQLELAYSQLVTLRAQLAATAADVATLGDLVAATLLDFEGPDHD
jgi:multidrug resistance efflux pump